MYRFRSLDNLLGKYQELEKQEIYFASLDELNDPMEGYINYYWKGDRIVWENLFKHYILCLDNLIFMCMLSKDEDEEIYKKLPIYLIKDDLSSDMYKKRINQIFKLFFENECVQFILNIVSDSPDRIYKKELNFYLVVIHIIAIKAIEKIDFENGIIEQLLTEKINLKEIDIRKICNNISKRDYNYFVKMIDDFINQLNMDISIKIGNRKRRRVIFVEFPQLYVEQILKLIYPNTYVACFMEEYEDSSIWGTYGDNHRGVCLKFKTDLNNPKLKLYESNNYKEFEFKKINYINEVEELNFFTNLGMLPKYKLDKWYKNDKGDISKCASDVYDNIESWRNKHWKQYEISLSRKFTDWKKEKEYRILLTDLLDEYEEVDNRKLKYKFNDLEAIIFGINTPKEKRIEIINIIKNKCKENGKRKFDFYEMNYSEYENKLKSRKIYSIDF